MSSWLGQMMGGGGGGNGGELGDGTVNGVMIGIVTSNQDPEGLARVKLKLPLHEGAEETDWARVATLFAGNDRGSLFVPEVGDEVLVAFHLGDIAQPIVIGALWNQTQAVPPVDPLNGIKKIRTTSGHEITFDDNVMGAVTIQTAGGQTITLDDGEGKITLAAGASTVEMSSDFLFGGINMTSGLASMSISPLGRVSIDSALSVDINALSVSLSAMTSLSLKALGMITVDAAGLLVLKGGLVKIN